MSPSGVSGYSAISARVRVMYATLLSPQEISGLCDAPDFFALLGLLKQTAWGPYIERVNEKDLTPRRAVFQIKGRLADAYTTIVHMAPKQAQVVLIQLFRYYEVGNLKAVLRGIVTGASWERVRYVLFPPSPITKIPAQAMAEAGNVSAAVELLRGTPYYETLSYAMKRYNAEQNLFPLEVALDLYYWRELWQRVNELPIQDRVPAQRIVGAMLDMNNLMWAIRYRVYHHLSEVELINYTLPFGYHVNDREIRTIAAGGDIATVVKQVYPDLVDVDTIAQEPWDRLPELELQLKRHVMKQCKAAYIGDPFQAGILLGYLVLSDYEIQDLTVLIEAKSSKTPIEGFQPYLSCDCTSKK